MDGKVRVLSRLLQAKTDEEVLELIESEPTLSSPEFAAFLQEQEREFREQGQGEAGDALAAIHRGLDVLLGLHNLKMPKRLGCGLAANLVAALIDAARDAAVPHAAISDPLYLVTGTMREILASTNAQGEAVDALHQLDERIAAAARQMDKRQRRQARDFLATMELWLESDAWDESKTVLAAHKELLSPDAVTILQILLQGAQKPEDQDERKLYEQHLEILARVPIEGMDAVYEQLIADEEREAAQADFRDKLLSAWLTPPEINKAFAPELPESSEELHNRLDDIEAALAAPPGKRPDYYKTQGAGVRFTSGTLLPEDLARAQDLYMRAVKQGGSGIQYVEEGLLHVIGAQADPAVLPFFVKALEISRPRDSFTGQRQRLALASIARIAIACNSAEAVQTLRDLTRDPKEGIRSNAAYYLGQVFLFAKQPLPPDVQADLTAVALNAGDFPSRYNARNVLRYSQLPIPLDAPDGVFVFTVDYLGSGYKSVTNVSRTIEALSSQTMEDLSYAILASVSFDSDHLHAFYMTGDERDGRFELDSAESHWGMGPVDMMWGGGQSAPLTDAEVTLGELGLRPRNKFSYVFDFGDNHEFNVQVTEVRPSANKRATYPRVSARHGRAPQQYPSEK